MAATTSLPRHDDFTWLRRVFEASCIVAALALLIWNLTRLAQAPHVLSWWLPVAVVFGLAAADVVSGLIHWLADTWEVRRSRQAAAQDDSA